MIYMHQFVDILQDGGRIAEGRDKAGTSAVTDAFGCPSLPYGKLMLSNSLLL